MTELFFHVVNMSIIASILAAVVLLLRLLLKKAPKWINVLLWGLVAIRLVFPFAIESPFSLIPETDWVVQETMVEEDKFIYSAPDTTSATDTLSPSKDVPVYYYPTEPVIEIHRGFSVSFMLCCIWLAGIAVLILHTVISSARLSKSVGTAIRIQDNVWESSAVDSPFILGLFYPRIYVPRGMSKDNLDYVIAHEEAHIHRRDHWWKPLGFLLLTLHWFNPLLWLSYVLFCRDIEMACDEYVVKAYDEVQRANYSEALLECSVTRKMIPSCPLAFGEVGVKERITTVLNYKKPAFWVVIVAMIACVAVALFFLTNPPMTINTCIEGIRFPCDDPSSSKSCFVEINGKIVRDEFKGHIIIDGKKIETSIDMLGNTPSIRYYEGSRLKSYGLFYILNDTFSKFAFEINESDEYVICGMSLENFENEMAKKNYYVGYQQYIDLYDSSSSDKDKILSNIYTEGCTVVIYGRNLNIEEINRTFYSGDNVMETTISTTYPDKSICYACISTCIKNKVYVQYCRLLFGNEVSQAEIEASLDDALVFSALRKTAFEFRKEKLQSLLAIDTMVEEDVYFSYTLLTDSLEYTDPKAQIYSKMLNAIDHYNSVHIEFYPYMLSPNLKVVCELDLDSGKAYQASYTNNELTQEYFSDGETVSELNHKRKYYDAEYCEAFTREDSGAISLSDRVTIGEDGLPCYYYRRNVTNCPLSSYTLFPQELAFSYLANFSRWTIVEETTFLGRQCVVIEGNNSPYISDKHNANTFRLTVDKETGIVLMLTGEKNGKDTKMIEVTALEIGISSVYQVTLTDIDLSEYSIK